MGYKRRKGKRVARVFFGLYHKDLQGEAGPEGYMGRKKRWNDSKKGLRLSKVWTSLASLPSEALEGIAMDPTAFFTLARTRHKIYLQRLAGKSPPWTDDVILQRYRF